MRQRVVQHIPLPHRELGQLSGFGLATGQEAAVPLQRHHGAFNAHQRCQVSGCCTRPGPHIQHPHARRGGPAPGPLTGRSKQRVLT